jgi:hypothetical protein
VEDQWHDHSTAPLAPIQDPEAAGRRLEAADLRGNATSLTAVLVALLAILSDLRKALDRQARPPLDRLAYRIDELSDALGVSRRAIERERSRGRFPKPDLVIGKMPLWRVESVRAFLERGGRP